MLAPASWFLSKTEGLLVRPGTHHRWHSDHSDYISSCDMPAHMRMSETGGTLGLDYSTISGLFLANGNLCQSRETSCRVTEASSLCFSTYGIAIETQSWWVHSFLACLYAINSIFCGHTNINNFVINIGPFPVMFFYRLTLVFVCSVCSWDSWEPCGAPWWLWLQPAGRAGPQNLVGYINQFINQSIKCIL
jgi:hypothetical protein